MYVSSKCIYLSEMLCMCRQIVFNYVLCMFHYIDLSEMLCVCRTRLFFLLWNIPTWPVMNKQGIESQYEDIIAVERLVAAGPAPTKQTPNFLNLVVLKTIKSSLNSSFEIYFCYL